LIGFCGCLKCDRKFVRPRDSQAVAIERASVIFAADKRPDLGDTRQVRGIKAANCATTDNADSLHRSSAVQNLEDARFSLCTCVSPVVKKESLNHRGHTGTQGYTAFFC